MPNYKEIFKGALLTEADDIDAAPLDESEIIPDENVRTDGDADPLITTTDDNAAAAEELGGQENINALGARMDTLDKYIKAQDIAVKLDAELVSRLVSRIEEIDNFVERLGGLSEESLLSILKKGAESNETLSSIYEREHRAIGKCTAQLSSFSQNLKSYL